MYKRQANIGLPVGDVSDFTGIAYGIEANYLFSVSDQFEVGPSVSLAGYTGKDYENTFAGVTVEIEGEGFTYLPIAAAARFNASEQFTVGLDLGYAIGISPDGNEGGFHYRPLVGYNISESAMIQLAYSAVSNDGATAANLGLGVVFGL